MSYLEQILAQNAQRSQRSNRRKASIQDLLTAVQAPPAQAATPAAGGASRAGGLPHSMGDAHNHGSQAEVNGLNAQFSSSLNRLIADSGGKIKIGSGYRSYDQQAKLYNDYLRGKPGQAKAAPPGKSNHNHGLAADLQYASPADRTWAHANAAKYGLRFPMSYEPWHIEPVNAKALRSGGKKR